MLKNYVITSQTHAVLLFSELVNIDQKYYIVQNKKQILELLSISYVLVVIQEPLALFDSYGTLSIDQKKTC